MTSFSPQDEHWMDRALELAARGRGSVEPNPMVGAVVVRDGQCIAEGYHQKYGGPHAEVVALDAAGAAAEGADIYVTLEPCCHFGKTPPCTQRVMAAGIRRVVVAMRDPFAAVAGKGFAELEAAGIAVEVGCREQESLTLNAPYRKLLQTGRPYFHAKWAMTLDGKIATQAGDSKWISSVASRRHAHQFRGLVDAIVVGMETALADDPELTARGEEGPRRTAHRVVLDSRGRLPLASKLVQSARQVPTVIATTDQSSAAFREQMTASGCDVWLLPSDSDRRVSIEALSLEMGKRRWTNVLIEGGAEVLGCFLRSGQVDAVRVYVAPILVGGTGAKGPLAGAGFDRLADSLRLPPLAATSLEGDWFFTAGRVEF